MAILLREAKERATAELRYDPTEKRVRAWLGDTVVADSTRAMLVWEPRRVLPHYAFAPEDLRAELIPSGPDAAIDNDVPDGGILHGGVPFVVHSTEGDSFDVRADGRTLKGAAFRPADPDLDGYVILDFHAFGEWREEEETIVSHPRDPYHRVDVRASSRHVRIELAGELLAETSRPHLVFETSLPVRFYLPREDVRVALRPNDTRTYCAYKGEASYWTFDLEGEPRADVVWSYEHPLPDAAELTGLVAFYDEKVDVTVDGERRGQERSGVAATIVAEAES